MKGTFKIVTHFSARMYFFLSNIMIFPKSKKATFNAYFRFLSCIFSVYFCVFHIFSLSRKAVFQPLSSCGYHHIAYKMKFLCRTARRPPELYSFQPFDCKSLFRALGNQVALNLGCQSESKRYYLGIYVV